MSARHTLGPWKVSENKFWKTNPFSVTTRKCGIHGVAVANLPARKTVSENERRANAHLIAAAPELLEALKTLPQSLASTDDDLNRWLEKARAAIAKAEGEKE